MRSSLWASSVRREGPRFSPDNGVSLTGTQAANGSEIYQERDGLLHPGTQTHSPLDTRSSQKNLRHFRISCPKSDEKKLAQTATIISARAVVILSLAHTCIAHKDLLVDYFQQ